MYYFCCWNKASFQPRFLINIISVIRLNDSDLQTFFFLYETACPCIWLRGEDTHKSGVCSSIWNHTRLTFHVIYMASIIRYIYNNSDIWCHHSSSHPSTFFSSYVTRYTPTRNCIGMELAMTWLIKFTCDFIFSPPLCVSIWIIFIFKGNKKRRESVTEGTKWQGKVTCSKSVCWLHKRERDSHVYNIRMWLCRFESSDLNKVNNVTRRRFINQFQLRKWFVKRWGVMAIFYLV